MLSRELMGLVALGVLWVNTLLVTLAAWGIVRDLLRRLSRMRALGVIEGQAKAPIAEHAVDQVGRRASDDADRKAILFHDRRYESRIVGGSLETDDAVLLLSEGENAEVWVASHEAGCESLEKFDEAYAWAKRARGFERRVVHALAGRVWIVGKREGERIHAPADSPLLVAAFDPRDWCRRRVALLSLFILSVLAVAGGITYLALYPPIFGTVSIVGGALGLVFFLLVQPAGTAIRDAVRVPSVAQLRGSWVRPKSEGQGSPLYAE